jgi:hypothetical protein
MLPTRRDLLKGLRGTLAFAITPAFANGNDDLLACKLETESVAHYDEPFQLTAQLEAKKPCCIYYPLSWGYVRGLRLFLKDANDTISEPQFHPNFEHPGPGSMSHSGNYRCIGAGKIASLTDNVKASSIFPTRGTFRLQLGYMSEASRVAGAPLPGTVVMEDGSLLSSWYPINVV